MVKKQTKNNENGTKERSMDSEIIYIYTLKVCVVPEILSTLIWTDQLSINYLISLIYGSYI